MITISINFITFSQKLAKHSSLLSKNTDLMSDVYIYSQKLICFQFQHSSRSQIFHTWKTSNKSGFIQVTLFVSFKFELVVVIVMCLRTTSVIVTSHLIVLGVFDFIWALQNLEISVEGIIKWFFFFFLICKLRFFFLENVVLVL